MSDRTHAAPNARLMRGLALGGLGVLLFVRTWSRIASFGDDGHSMVGEAAFLAPFFLAFAGSVWARSRSRGVERRFWTLLSVATGLWAASEVYFSAYLLYVDPKGPQLPSAFELLHVGAVATLIGLIVTIARFEDGGIILKLRYFAGALAGVVAIYIVVFDTLVMPAFSSAGSPAALAAIAALYPVVAIVLVVGMFGAVLGWKTSRYRPWQPIAAAAFVITALGLAAMPMWFLGLQDAPMSPLGITTELGLGLGPYLLFLAAVWRITSIDDSDALVARPRLDDPPAWLHVSYPIALALAVPVFGLHARSVPVDGYRVVVQLADVVLVTVLLARSWLSALELRSQRLASSIDSVTGLKDERALARDLELDVAEAQRWGGEMALVALDIDDLTRVNELFGHAEGDRVLHEVAEAIRSHCGESCDLYRAGSDEFVVVAPGVASDAAAQLAALLARRVEHEIVSHGMPVTVTAGVSTLSSSSGARSMIQEAFSALQSAKIQQRGSVLVFGGEEAERRSPEERFELARKEAYRSTVRALAAAVDARDPSSREHSQKVGQLARELATELGLAPQRALAIETAGLVHDIGKLALPDELLWKREELDENERARLREHVEIGERILRSTEIEFILPWVRGHHERWDGAGYPDGLAGERIPLEARVLAICDAFDAMTSGIFRAQRMNPQQALAEIAANAGTQFDPGTARAFTVLMSRRAQRGVPPELSTG